MLARCQYFRGRIDISERWIFLTVCVGAVGFAEESWLCEGCSAIGFCPLCGGYSMAGLCPSQEDDLAGVHCSGEHSDSGA